MRRAPGAATEAILTRRSVGRVDEEPPARGVIETLIEAALRAPNHGLTHPWRFVVLEGEARRAAGEAHLAAIEQSRGALEAEARAKEAARFERAPTVIVCVCASDSRDRVVRREDRDAVAAGVQNLLLAAHDAGLGAIWRTGPMVEEAPLRAHLGVAGDEEIVAFVYVGRPAGQPRGALTRRPAVSHVTEWRGPAGGRTVRSEEAPS